MCSLVLLLFLIGGYNTVLAMREQRDEIARLTAELEGSKMTVSALKEQQAKTTKVQMPRIQTEAGRTALTKGKVRDLAARSLWK